VAGELALPDGVRSTTQRLAVLRAVSESSGSFTVAELHDRARRFEPRLGLATTYRTVELLRSTGGFHPLLGEGRPTYVRCRPEHHHHLVCTSCGGVEETELCAAPSESELQRRLWDLAGKALDAQPTHSAPRLYVESLNEMIDMQTTRLSALNNRVPAAILLFEVVGSAVALALMAFYLALLSRGVVTVLLAAGVLTLLLFVSFDLDRPTRGFITIPSAPLVALRASMEQPPAAHPG